MSMKVITVQDAKAYIEGIKLPAGLEDAIENPPADLSNPAPQVVAVGSQIAEFTENIAPEYREHIANSFLLAQLAANQAVKGQPSSSIWYRTYVDTLAHSGWLIENDAQGQQESDHSDGTVHQAIISVLTTILGPAVAAATMVIAVLNGLKEMDKDKPWITLFSKESQRVSANQFQIAYVSAAEGGVPRISLTCFELKASKSITQVLFFKFSDESAVLRYFNSALSVNTAIIEQIKPVVANLVAARLSKYLTEIDLG